MPTLAPALQAQALPPLPHLALAPDATLVERCRAGDERAFEAIYARYHSALYRYCRSIMGAHEDAEEALQSTMMKAYRALRTADRPVALRPWLYRIAHNESVRAVSGRPRHDELSGSEEAVGEGSEERAEIRADLDQLRRDLAALPEAQRSALVLRELSGLSHREIGESLGTTTEAAKQLIYEARQTLHEFGEGRSLACADVRKRLSEGDGRVLRARRMGAHLRTCSGCRAFRERLATRPRQLAALFPALPLAAAQGVLQAVLGGAGGGAAGALVSGGLGGVGLKAACVAALALIAGAGTLPSAGSGGGSAAGSPTRAAAAARGSLLTPAPAVIPTSPAPAGALGGAPAWRLVAAADDRPASTFALAENHAGAAPELPAPPAGGALTSPATPSSEPPPGSAGAAGSGGVPARPAPAQRSEAEPPTVATPPAASDPTTAPSGPAMPDAAPPSLPAVSLPPVLVLPPLAIPALPTVTAPALPPLPAPFGPLPPLPDITLPPPPPAPELSTPELTVPQVAAPALPVPPPPAPLP